jgi:hypothetical protein
VAKKHERSPGKRRGAHSLINGFGHLVLRRSLPEVVLAIIYSSRSKDCRRHIERQATGAYEACKKNG